MTASARHSHGASSGAAPARPDRRRGHRARLRRRVHRRAVRPGVGTLTPRRRSPPPGTPGCATSTPRRGTAAGCPSCGRAPGCAITRATSSPSRPRWVAGCDPSPVRRSTVPRGSADVATRSSSTTRTTASCDRWSRAGFDWASPGSTSPSSTTSTGSTSTSRRGTRTSATSPPRAGGPSRNCAPAARSGRSAPGSTRSGLIPRFLDALDLDAFLVAMPYTLLHQEVLDEEFPAAVARRRRVRDRRRVPVGDPGDRGRRRRDVRLRPRHAGRARARAPDRGRVRSARRSARRRRPPVPAGASVGRRP